MCFYQRFVTRAVAQRRSTHLPLPQEENGYCKFVISQLLKQSEAKAKTDPRAPSALLYDIKGACGKVDFGEQSPPSPGVCTVRGARAGETPAWLAAFTPLHPELQQALDATRGRFPDRVRSAEPLTRQ
jgi:hypothetical protein